MQRPLSRFERDFVDLHGHRPKVFRIPARRPATPTKPAAHLLDGVPWIGRVGLWVLLGLIWLALAGLLLAMLGGVGLFFWEAVREWGR